MTRPFLPNDSPRQAARNLDKSQLGGGDVEGIDIGRQAGIGLLGSIRARGTWSV